MEAQTKKNILIGLAVSAGVLLLAALIWFLIFKGQFNAYKDNTYGFSINYPFKWEKVVHSQAGAAVVFVSPPETALDVFRENVNISIEPVSADLASLKNFTDKVILQMTKVFGNIKVAESKEINFGGRKGYRVLFAADKPDKVRILTAWTIKGAEKAYILTYMATAKKYEDYLPLVEEMIRSFRLN